MKFQKPILAEVTSELKRALDWNMKHGIETEVRLQVLDDGQWFLHYGDPCFDTHHQGYWGNSTLGWNEASTKLTMKNVDVELLDIACELIDAAEDCFFDSQEEN